MEKKMKQKTMKLRAAAVFFATLLVTMGCVFLLNQSQEKQARLKAAYTAESTVNMVESQLNKYLVESDLMKNVVESGYDITDEQFNQLAALRDNLKRPGVVRYLTGYLHRILKASVLALSDGNPLPGRHGPLPDPVVVAHILQFIQLNLIDEFFPVDNQE